MNEINYNIANDLRKAAAEWKAAEIRSNKVTKIIKKECAVINKIADIVNAAVK